MNYPAIRESQTQAHANALITTQTESLLCHWSRCRCCDITKMPTMPSSIQST